MIGQSAILKVKKKICKKKKKKKKKKNFSPSRDRRGKDRDGRRRRRRAPRVSHGKVKLLDRPAQRAKLLHGQPGPLAAALGEMQVGDSAVAAAAAAVLGAHAGAAAADAVPQAPEVGAAGVAGGDSRGAGPGGEGRLPVRASDGEG